MKVLITGAAGLMGHQAAELAAKKHECLPCTRDDLDILSSASIDRVFEKFRPQAVLHCAAYTDVDGAEREPAQAMRLNVDGARNVAVAASQYGARLLYLSTDYVFDGESEQPYREEDKPRPLSQYARSKLEGERAVQSECSAHVILRTGWLYGRGKGFVDWLCGKLRGSVEPVRLVEDQFGSPTSAPELASAMLSAVELELQGVCHFVNRGTTNWLGFGRAVAEVMGMSERPLEAISHVDLKRPAPRPRYSSLSVTRYEEATGLRVAAWREALERYLCPTEGTSQDEAI